MQFRRPSGPNFATPRGGAAEIGALYLLPANFVSDLMIDRYLLLGRPLELATFFFDENFNPGILRPSPILVLCADPVPSSLPSLAAAGSCILLQTL